MTVAYDLRQVSFRYPGQNEPANSAISFQVFSGEVFGLLGDNGAGKTTLVKQMVNLLRGGTGSICLFGAEIHHNPRQVSASVGYMPQEGGALNNLTTAEALYFTAHLRGCSRPDARAERDRLMALWQIEDLARKPFIRLSGGQRRLVRLAVAMAARPPVLLLDEPTNDLDPQRRKLVWDVLRDENQSRGTTIFFITHDAIEAEKIIQRVGILRQGRLVAVGAPAELKRAIDRKLRLELFTAAEGAALPPGLTWRELQPGRWITLLDWDAAPEVMARLPLHNLLDFRLYSATLEDLYLHYAGQPA